MYALTICDIHFCHQDILWRFYCILCGWAGNKMAWDPVFTIRRVKEVKNMGWFSTGGGNETADWQFVAEGKATWNPIWKLWLGKGGLERASYHRAYRNAVTDRAGKNAALSKDDSRWISVRNHGWGTVSYCLSFRRFIRGRDFECCHQCGYFCTKPRGHDFELAIEGVKKAKKANCQI